MKSLHHLALGACSAAALVLLAACTSGSSEEGIEASIKAVPVAAAHSHAASAASGAIVPKHEEGELPEFRRADGVKIELQLGLLNLVPVELLRCEASVAALQQLGRDLSPIAAAYAHGGEEGEAPEGSVSVVGSEETDLGSLHATPGRYCGIVVQLLPGAAAVTPKHGGELDTSMAGASINVAPCYYASTAGLSDEAAEAVTSHACIQAKFSGAAREVSLPFTAPVTLDKNNRDLDITIATRYEEWFDGIDFSKLATDAAEQAKLADNVAWSLQALTGEEQLVNLAFQIKVAGQEAVCGQTYDGLGNGAQRDLRVEGFRFYASDFALENATGSQSVRLAQKANGTVLQTATHGVTLIGHAQGCDSPAPLRNLSVSGTVKKGDYNKICFLLGVPFELGHSDPATAPSPLNVTGMDWSWLFGRMNFRFDSVADPDGTPEEFFVHLGSTGCSNGTAPEFGAPPTEECVHPNRPRICLDYAEIEEGHPIVADIAPLISQVDITRNTADTAPGCMSFEGDPECTTVIPKFGLDYALSDSNLVPRQDQLLFTVGE